MEKYFFVSDLDTSHTCTYIAKFEHEFYFTMFCTGSNMFCIWFQFFSGAVDVGSVFVNKPCLHWNEAGLVRLKGLKVCDCSNHFGLCLWMITLKSNNMWICAIISNLRQTLHLQFLLFLDRLKYTFKTKYVSGKYTLKCIWIICNYCLSELQEPSLIALRHEDYIKFDNLLKIHLSLFMLAYLSFSCVPAYHFSCLPTCRFSWLPICSLFMLAFHSSFMPVSLPVLFYVPTGSPLLWMSTCLHVYMFHACLPVHFVPAYLSFFMIAYSSAFHYCLPIPFHVWPTCPLSCMPTFPLSSLSTCPFSCLPYPQFCDFLTTYLKRLM